MMECRTYRGPRFPFGYGRLTHPGERGWGQTLHTWIVEQVDGPLAPGEVVRHKCGNPSCFLYDHLERGTMGDNNRDTVAHGHNLNAQKTRCPNDHEYDEVNTYTAKSGSRHCRACDRDRKKAAYHGM